MPIKSIVIWEASWWSKYSFNRNRAPIIKSKFRWVLPHWVGKG